MYSNYFLDQNIFMIFIKYIMMNIDCLLELKFDEYHFAIEPEKLVHTGSEK